MSVDHVIWLWLRFELVIGKIHGADHGSEIERKRIVHPNHISSLTHGTMFFMGETGCRGCSLLLNINELDFSCLHAHSAINLNSSVSSEKS